ncbi:MAG: MBL fold metallo-hydrolase [Candidatus Sungbacteria bacterium]|uniref:MBL fold metallo-hydrolase n=1 Tax=Candidatus Sungiibacteriota bacterium TaxID=2750080 RepID=A0A931WPY6_9BACT|nr:MBL fold metallo-hydrolase [Candidatus Sungbacteria bacterium]
MIPLRLTLRGPIYSTNPTKELSKLMLEDGYSILEKESRACGEEAPYAAGDIERALEQWRGVRYHEPITAGDIRLNFLLAGHILGSAMLDLRLAGRRMVFSGDLGTNASLLLPDADIIDQVDYLVIESTYGDAIHQSVEDGEIFLERAIEDVAARGGTLMIPAFATERTQDILFLLNKMVIEKRIPEVPMFVDSPLAIKITEVFEKYHDYFSDEVKALYLKHPHLFEFRGLRRTPTAEESKAINNVPPPKVIIAGSGMMTGGRILHHLKRYLPDPRSSLLIVGYQASGSIGRSIIEGADSVEIFNERVPVRAKIIQAQGFSAHADRERLFEFIKHLKYSLKHVFAVHAEPDKAESLVQVVRDRLGIAADAPKLGDVFMLE